MTRRSSGLGFLVCAGLIAACTKPAPPPPPPPPPALTFRVVLDELPAPLLSAWQSPDGVLYAVGGTTTRALVLRHDDRGWWEMDPGTSQGLWWVFGFSASDVYAVGNAGVVTHFDGTRWTTLREGDDYTLYGAWGPSPGHVLAVGGNVASSRARGVMLSEESGWGELRGLDPTRPLFKISGQSSSDVVVVGERGLIASGPVGALSVLPAQRLTTVDVSGGTAWAVGGLTEPVLLRRTDATWKLVTVPGSPAVLNGVAIAPDGSVLAVGLDGYLALGTGGTFTQLASPTTRGLHGAVSTGDGFVAVGGELLGTLGHGVLLASGTLGTGAPQPWPFAGVRFDAGVDAGTDAGLDDAGSDAGLDDGGLDAGDDGGTDAGSIGPGESCDSMPAGCAPGLDCWFVFGPYKSWCGARCTDVSECGSLYGVNACCKVPGPQAMFAVCLPEVACDGG